MTTIFDLYFYRGELLDTAAEAALKERPFYLQSSLDDINDQIRLLENITPETNGGYLGSFIGFDTQAAILRRDVDGLNKWSGYTDWKLNYKGLAESASFTKDLNAWWVDHYSDENMKAKQVEAAKVQAEVLKTR